jgi:hypothetical protein
MHCGRPGFFGQHLEVLVEALLGGFVVIRGNLEGCVGAAFLSEFRESQRFGRAVRACARHHLDAASDGFDHEGNDAVLLVVAERGRLAGGAHGAQAGRASGDLEFDLGLERFKVDLPLFEGGNDCDRQAGKCLSFSLHQTGASQLRECVQPDSGIIGKAVSAGNWPRANGPICRES